MLDALDDRGTSRSRRVSGRVTVTENGGEPSLLSDAQQNQLYDLLYDVRAVLC